MGRELIYAETEWSTIDSSDNTYATARSGAGTKTLPSTASTHGVVGQADIGATYHVYEQLHQFDASGLAATDLVTSANFRFTTSDPPPGVSPGWDLEIRQSDWGTVAQTSDYVSGADLSGLPRFGTVADMDKPPAARWLRAGTTALVTELATPGDIRVLLSSSRERLNREPSEFENRDLYGQNASNADRRPRLEIFTVRRGVLNQVGGAMAQLSDGTHVYLQSNAATSPTITLKHRDHSNTVITVSTLSTGNGAGSFRSLNAYQALALVTDEQDNIYVIGRDGANSQAINSKCFRKGAGYTWAAKPSMVSELVGYDDGGINNLAAAYHQTEDGPRVTVFAGHAAGQGGAKAFGFATLDAAVLRTGDGVPLVQAFASPSWLSIRQGALNYVNYPNETGSNLDVAVDRTKGAVFTLYGGDGITTGKLEIGKYDLDGPEASQGAFVVKGTEVTQPKNGDSKVRSLSIGARGVVHLAMGRLVFRSWGGSTLASVSLYDDEPAGFPADLSTTTAWDAIYDAGSDKVWIYYLDSAASRTLKRVGVSLTTYTIDTAPVTVSSSVGDVGSANYSIRVPRGPVDERLVLVHVANLDGSTYSTVALVDTFNVAPTAPLLYKRTNFDVRVDTTFTWKFNDPNLRDTQSAYQLQIVDVSDMSLDYDSTKLAGTEPAHILLADDPGMANGKSYQWRVKTWDAADAASPWSDYRTFDTAEQGEVVITDPGFDNVGGIASSEYDVIWTFESTTLAAQSQRRVRVIRTSDEAEMSDTGFEATASLTYQVENMESEVEYRIEVTVIDSDLLTSNTAERLITPEYTKPGVPAITLTVAGLAVQVEVSNPEPVGSQPVVLHNLVYRRIAGGDPDHEAAESGKWINIGQTDPNGTFIDYETAAGVLYEYAVAAVG